jgi:hypothetical protein
VFLFQLNDKAASHVATHVILLLSEHVELLLAKMSDLPVKIIEVMFHDFCYLLLYFRCPYLYKGSNARTEMLV